MKEYYAVVRSTDHLAHYGVKGMRWGVRRALATGNYKALDRHYRKAARKLAKLQDIGNHSMKYAAKAGAYGAAAAGTGALAIGGTGLAAKGIKGVRYGLRTLGQLTDKYGHPLKNKYGTALKDRPLKKLSDAAEGLEKWGNTEVTHKIWKPGIKEDRIAKIPVLDAEGNQKVIKVSNNTLFRLGAAGVTAGLAAKAAQNVHRVRNAEKYREKAERFKQEMDDVFAGTDYEGHYEKRRRRRRY